MRSIMGTWGSLDIQRSFIQKLVAITVNFVGCMVEQTNFEHH